VSHPFTESDPASWSGLETILPQARPETSGGTQTEKILAGEYVAGFFISAGPAYPIVGNSNGLLKVVFTDDGTVVLPRGIGIAPTAPHANTAKLFLDFTLSEEGQRAVAEVGLTSYRDSVQPVPTCTPTRR
jgi:iron(III) transport system substrate-binding protein